MDMNMMNNQNKATGAPRPHGTRRLAFWGGMLLLVVLAVAALGLLKIFEDRIKTGMMVKSEYQSVFLTNGQVYFGKLAFWGGWAVMTDVYYLQVTENLQAASGTDANPGSTGQQQGNQQQNIQLVKLGNELHGPEDTMYIAKDKILFWENMKDDAKVRQSIRQSKD